MSDDHADAVAAHIAKLSRHREVSAELKDLRLKARIAKADYQKTEDDLTALQVSSVGCAPPAALSLQPS